MISPLPTQQRALVIPERKAEFKLVTIDVPRAQPGEVLVKVHVTALNPADWKVQEYAFSFISEDAYPLVLGLDIAGEVVELGEGVADFAVGDRVVFQGVINKNLQNAGFQQYSRVDASMLARIPASVSTAEAATLPLALATAYLALYGDGASGFGLDSPAIHANQGKYKNQPLVVIGGSTSVGQAAIQLARLSGLNPIIATASLKNTEYLKSLGATHIVDRSLPIEAIQPEIQSILDSKSLNLLLDTNSSTTEMGLRLLSEGGHLVLAAGQTDGTVVDGKRTSHVFAGKELPANAEHFRALYSSLYGWLEAGFIKPNRVEVIPGGLNGVMEGLQRLKSGLVSAQKLVVLPPDTE